MDWVMTAMKYAPEILGIARAATAWVTANGNADSGTQLVKSVVMVGVKEVAGECCESGISSGVTVFLSSASFDVAATTATGRDYGMVKDFRNGDYLDVGAQGLNDFATGYFLYKGDDKDKQDGKKDELRPKDKKTGEPVEPPLGLPDPRHDGFPMFESISEMELRLEDIGPGRQVVRVCLQEQILTLMTMETRKWAMTTFTNEPPREKTNSVVSAQVRHKPTCTVTEKKLEA